MLPNPSYPQLRRCRSGYPPPLLSPPPSPSLTHPLVLQLQLGLFITYE